MESSWRPASAEEGFEIVRRRLFDDLPAEAAPARDAVVKAFGALYRTQKAEFPSGCSEGDYERRLTAAYPIHPELFDRLYGEWSTLDKFQRTRGVLRLMAAVIHELWERNDSSLLIMPATVPIDAQTVSSELTRYLEEGWTPVIESDVDGPNALPLRLDRDNPNLGRYSASRRVARTYLPGVGTDAAGGQPGNRRPVDQARRASSRARRRQPSATRCGGSLTRRPTFTSTGSGTGTRFSRQSPALAHDRAASHFSDDDVDEEIRRRLGSRHAGRAARRLHQRPPGPTDTDRGARRAGSPPRGARS